MALNLITIGNIKMNNVFEVRNNATGYTSLVKYDCLKACQIAKDLSAVQIAGFDVLKNGLRFATSYDGKLDIILPKQTFLEG